MTTAEVLGIEEQQLFAADAYKQPDNDPRLFDPAPFFAEARALLEVE